MRLLISCACTALVFDADLRVQENHVIVSSANDRHVCISDLRANDFMILKGHTGPVTTLHLVDDWHVASGSADGSVRVWDLRSAAHAHSSTSTVLQRPSHKWLPSPVMSVSQRMGMLVCAHDNGDLIEYDPSLEPGSSVTCNITRFSPGLRDVLVSVEVQDHTLVCIGKWGDYWSHVSVCWWVICAPVRLCVSGRGVVLLAGGAWRHGCLVMEPPRRL